MSKRIKINSVSDVSCPWCIIGLKSLAEALRLVSAEVTADMHFSPFELNLQMDAADEDKAEHLGKKYGATPEQAARSRDAIRARASTSSRRTMPCRRFS